MSDHSLGLQKTIFDALDGDSTLQSLVTDVFDFVPENTAWIKFNSFWSKSC